MSKPNRSHVTDPRIVASWKRTDSGPNKRMRDAAKMHARLVADAVRAGGRPGDVPVWESTSGEHLDPGLNREEKARLSQVGGAISKATTANPKDLFGSVKVSFTKVSAIALAHCAHAMMDGARKYGPYNWRAKPVIVSIYIDAGMRHMLAYFEGERCAQDSKAHHLGHAMACSAILIDAEAHGCLIDDRPNGKAIFSRVLEEISALIKQAQAEHAAKEAAFLTTKKQKRKTH